VSLLLWRVSHRAATDALLNELISVLRNESDLSISVHAMVVLCGLLYSSAEAREIAALSTDLRSMIEVFLPISDPELAFYSMLCYRLLLNNKLSPSFA